LTLDDVLNDPKVKETGSIEDSIHTVTVPGAVAAYLDIFEYFGSGKCDLSSIIDPSIKMAENG
jgi:gamma-glutamyltranspeptidase/glutathione hydrolase